MMKQSEKLDTLLKELYKYKVNNQSGYYSVTEIMEELNIPLRSDEAWELGNRLKNDRLVNAQGTHNDMLVEINSYGIEYCEEDSFSKHGVPIINSINILNSSGITVIQSSTGITINHTSEETNQILERIYMAIQVSSELNEDLQKEANERLTEIKEYLEVTKKLPKYGFNDLLEIMLVLFHCC